MEYSQFLLLVPGMDVPTRRLVESEMVTVSETHLEDAILLRVKAELCPPLHISTFEDVTW